MFLKFLGQIAATIIGLFIFFFFSFFLLIGIATVLGGAEDTIEPINTDTVITLDINEVSQDYSGKFRYNEFEFNDEDNNGFIDVLNALEQAKTDTNIKGISILNSHISLGMAQSKALRDKLKDFKSTGKFVVAYADNYNQKNYYVNSIADTLYLNPIGELDFKGLTAEVLYFKDFQDKYGIKMEIIRHGKYKSAVEPFLANKMSAENKEQISTIINSVWDVMASDISESRKISIDSLNLIANGLLAKTPEQAVALNLIDKVDYEDNYHNGIKKALGLPKSDDYPTINIIDYGKSKFSVPTQESSIAILYAQGVIWGGEGDDTYIGEQSIKRALGSARKDDSIKAIVIRVDSPGGSALTSELIWREIELTRKIKPVIVSMGNTAASGGYYIACGADKIFAEPNTITGSIGVFGQLPNFSELTKDMGISTQLVQTHDNAAEYSPFRPLDNGFKNNITQSIESIYATFLQRVATGRKMTTEEVDKIAQGRVWTGLDAIEIGLVDEIGGLEDAIAYAAEVTETKEYKIINYPEYNRDFEDLVNQFMGVSLFQSKESLLKEELGAKSYALIQQIKEMNRRKGTQMILPYQLNIK